VPAEPPADRDIFRMVDGKIVERWGQLDQLGLLHQLGLTPK
jgi:predicted ester cyclase